VAAWNGVQAQPAPSWPEAAREAKAGSRWWWLGSAVDKDNLRWQMEQLAAAGIGTLEITPIYGVKGNEGKNITFLSPQWLEMMNYTRQVGNELGIDIDMTKTEASAINAYLNQAYKKTSKYTYDTKDRSERVPLERKSGVQHCDGIQALMYARLRSIDSDFVRTARTRHLLDCLLKQSLEKIKANKLNVLDLVSDAIAYPVTNLNPSTIMQLIGKVMSSDVMDHLDSADSIITEFRIPIDGYWKYDTIDGASVTVMKDKQYTVESLHEFIYGQYYPANAQ
jgi:hypothetical protein